MHIDLVCVLGLLLLTAVVQWNLLLDGTLVGLDSATQWYPWYSFLGESLRSGHIPMWNPHSFAGTPFAADPLSGWTYLPAMVLFTIFPVSAAAKAYLFVHPLLAGLSMYALARTLRVNVVGAVMASIVYEFNGFMYHRNSCCFAFASVAAWLPLIILAAELALRSHGLTRRALWWGVSGFALSQVFAAWPGQGSYYVLLTLGGYLAYRTLLDPSGQDRRVPRRISDLLLHGAGIVLFGVALAAAGLLPRIEYNGLSNLAGGYADNEFLVLRGWSLRQWSTLLSPGSVWYAGGAAVALAAVAPVLARRRMAVPYWATLCIITLILSGQGPSPVHWVFYHLPGFAQLHPHGPDRIVMVFYLGAALLAGATITSLGRSGPRATFVSVVLILVMLLLTAIGASVPSEAVGGMILVAVLTALGAAIPSKRLLVFLLLLLIVFADLYVADQTILERGETSHGSARLVKADLGSYYQLSGAVRFLQARQREQPFRYFGYSPSPRQPGNQSRWMFWDPAVRALEVHNRAIVSGLQDVQGYNPVHIARYGEYVDALNGRGQDYHFTKVFGSGLESPLLDLLNVRYVIVPTAATANTKLPPELDAGYTTVYQDEEARVLQNREAFPRAWIVHSAQRVGPGEALQALASGRVDPARTALVEQPLPTLGDTFPNSVDTATVIDYSAEHVRLTTSTEAPGLLVLSEVYYPAWKAYVDSRPAPLYPADHILRAVPVPQGRHVVELRYESSSLRAGIAISLGSYVALIMLALLVSRDRRRRATKQPTMGAMPAAGIQ